MSLIAPLAFIAFLIRHFGIESEAFARLAALSFAGFAVHYFLPLRYRLPFFVVLSISAVGFLLGIRPTLWLVGIGLGLIALCHLPVSMRVRVAIVVLAGTLLLLLRANVIGAPWPSAIWPVLASMFMFRLAVYLYDIGHEPSLAALWPTLSYFFLLPNVCFPLFPVVDYKIFRRTYYNADRHDIYHVGVRWIFRGVLQLIAYRIVYLHLVTDANSVVTVLDLAST